MLQFVEGFELVSNSTDLALKGYSFGNGYGTKSIVAGRNAGQAEEMTSVKVQMGSGKSAYNTMQYPWTYFPIGESTASGVVGFAFNSNTALEGNYRVLFALYDTNGFAQFYIAKGGNFLYLFQPINGTSAAPSNFGNPYAYDCINSGATWTALADSSSSGFAITEGNWFYLEIKFVLGTSGGVTINCNGTQILSYTTATFSPSGTGHTYNNLANKFALGYSILGNFTGTGYTTITPQENLFDDVYVVDLTGSQNNTFLGNCSITGLRPNGNVATGFDASVVPNWSCVNTTSPSTNTKYVSTAIDDAIDVYDFLSTPQAGNLFGICYNVCGVTAGGSGSITPLCEISGTQYLGSAVSINTGSIATFKQIVENNPATSDPWTQAEVNDTFFGIKFTTP